MTAQNSIVFLVLNLCHTSFHLRSLFVSCDPRRRGAARLYERKRLESIISVENAREETRAEVTGLDYRCSSRRNLSFTFKQWINSRLTKIQVVGITRYDHTERTRNRALLDKYSLSAYFIYLWVLIEHIETSKNSSFIEHGLF